MNVNTISLQNLLYKSSCILIAVKTVDNDMTDYFFRVKLKGVRSNSPLGRYQTDTMVLAVRACGTTIVSYCDVSDGAIGKAIWQLICQCLKREVLDIYIAALFDIVYELADRRNLNVIPGYFITIDKEEKCA